MFNPISKVARTPKQRTIIWVLIVLSLMLMLFGGNLMRKFGNSKKITVWGLGLKSDNFYALVSSFKSSGFKVNVEYIEKEELTYENDLNQALIQGKGPDIFMLNNSWVGKYKNIITPLNLTLEKDFNINKIRNEFPSVVESDMVEGNSLYGLPLSIDTLALYYNRNVLDQSGLASTPRTWGELVSVLPKLRTIDQYKRVLRACIPLGLADNVNYSADILGLLMMQNGAKIVDDTHTRVDINNSVLIGNSYTSPGDTALSFYTQFAKPSLSSYTWNSSFPNSLDAFAFGQSVFYIGYASDRAKILEKNPNLVFGISEIPQVNFGDKVNFASFNNFVVSNTSKDGKLAWELIKYLTSDEIQGKYLQISNMPAGKRVGVDMCNSDPNLAVFCRNILTARSYYRADYVESNNILMGMINDVSLKNIDIKGAVENGNNTLGYTLYKNN